MFMSSYHHLTQISLALPVGGGGGERFHTDAETNKK